MRQSSAGDYPDANDWKYSNQVLPVLRLSIRDFLNHNKC